jgi:hypothetical protein
MKTSRTDAPPRGSRRVGLARDGRQPRDAVAGPDRARQPALAHLQAYCAGPFDKCMRFILRRHVATLRIRPSLPMNAIDSGMKVFFIQKLCGSAFSNTKIIRGRV